MLPLEISGMVIHKIMGKSIPNGLSWTVKCINNILPKKLKIHFLFALNFIISENGVSDTESNTHVAIL